MYRVIIAYLHIQNLLAHPVSKIVFMYLKFFKFPKRSNFGGLQIIEKKSLLMKWDQQLLLSLWTVFSQLIFSKLALALEKRGCYRNFALGIFNAYPTTVVTYAMRWVKANSVTLQNYIHSVWKIKEKVSFYSKIASGANYIYHQIKYF